jgi:hypothetical protein
VNIDLHGITRLLTHTHNLDVAASSMDRRPSGMKRSPRPDTQSYLRCELGISVRSLAGLVTQIGALSSATSSILKTPPHPVPTP